MISPLNQLPLLKYRNIVTEPAGGQAMGNVNGAFAPHQCFETGIYFIFRHGIKGRGGFIQDNEGRVLIQSSCQGNFLCLSPGNFHAVRLKIPVQRSIQTSGHIRHTVGKARFVQAILCLLPIHFHGGRHILSEGKRK